MNTLSPKEKANQNLFIIKQALDASAKGGVFENMDVAFGVASAFNFIAEIVKEHFNGNTGAAGSTGDSTQD